MVGETNLSRIDRQVCPCQEDKDGWEKVSLKRVKSRQHYMESNSSNEPFEQASLSRRAGPNIPSTDDGTEIVRENFPDCNMVCPACGEEYIVVCQVLTKEEADQRKSERQEETAETYTELYEEYGGHRKV